MKQRINFLEIYLNAQPKFKTIHIGMCWALTFILMLSFTLMVHNKKTKALAKLEHLQSESQKISVELSAISYQIKKDIGAPLSEEIKRLSQRVKLKDELLIFLNNLKDDDPHHLTHYLDKLTENHIKGTVIERISVKRGQDFSFEGKAISANLVPKMLTPWERGEGRKANSKNAVKIHKMKGQNNHVNFTIQVRQ